MAWWKKLLIFFLIIGFGAAGYYYGKNTQLGQLSTQGPQQEPIELKPTTPFEDGITIEAEATKCPEPKVVTKIKYRIKRVEVPVYVTPSCPAVTCPTPKVTDANCVINWETTRIMCYIPKGVDPSAFQNSLSKWSVNAITPERLNQQNQIQVELQ